MNPLVVDVAVVGSILCAILAVLGSALVFLVSRGFVWSDAVLLAASALLGVAGATKFARGAA